MPPRSTTSVTPRRAAAALEAEVDLLGLGGRVGEHQPDAVDGAEVAGAALVGLGVDHDQRLPPHIGAVTFDDVMRVAHRLLDPARAVVVVAGPWSGPAA